MTELKGFKILLAKAYLDKGWSLSSYIKYAVALFAIRVTDVKLAVVVGVLYILFCYLLGRWWYDNKFTNTEHEIDNIFNPFVSDMRQKFGIPNKAKNI